VQDLEIQNGIVVLDGQLEAFDNFSLHDDGDV
jgi:hypothetical protein